MVKGLQSWWDIETSAAKINNVSQSKKDFCAEKKLESTTKITGKEYGMGVLLSEPEAKLPNNLLNLGSI